MECFWNILVHQVDGIEGLHVSIDTVFYTQAFLCQVSPGIFRLHVEVLTFHDSTSLGGWNGNHTDVGNFTDEL